jgi:hypothetical protein
MRGFTGCMMQTWSQKTQNPFAFWANSGLLLDVRQWIDANVSGDIPMYSAILTMSALER